MAPNTLYFRLWLPSTLLILFAFLLPASLALLTPSLGIDFEIDDDNQQLLVAAVNRSDILQSQLKPGDRILGIRKSDDKQFIPLDAQVLIEEPDVIADYAEFNRFFDKQEAIYQVLLAPEVVLQSSRGEILATPKKRELSAIPFVFWFQILCGIITAVTALSMYVFARPSTAVNSLLLNGFSFYLVTLAAAPYSSRELAMPGDLFATLDTLNHLGALMFTGSFVALFWSYPKALKTPAKVNILTLMAGIYLLIWIADHTQTLINYDYSMRWPILIGLVSSIVLGFCQWYLNRKNAVERAALRWFFLSILIVASVYVLTLVGSNLLGIELEISQGYGFGILVLMYFGLVLGVSRYRLFQLESWWTKVWLWLMAGALILVLDAIFIYLVNLNESIALLGSVALAGWLYFPLRQYLSRTLLYRSDQINEQLFSDIVAVGVSWAMPERFRQRYSHLLEKLFNPLEIRFDESLQLKDVQVSKDGTLLSLPAINQLPTTSMYMPQMGRHLFNSQDIRLARQLVALLNQIIDSQTSFELGQQEERQRIYGDLHDDLGAKLLSLTYRVNDPEVSDLARSALQDLRDVVSRSEREAVPMAELLADWHAESENRLDLAGIELEWDQPFEFNEHINSSLWALNLGRVLREAVSNIIKHSQSKQAHISIEKSDSSYRFIIEDFGQLIPEHIKFEGRGTNNMISRANKLGGKISWQRKNQGGCRVELEIKA